MKKRNIVIIVVFLAILVGYCALVYEPKESLEDELARITPEPTQIALTEQLGVTIDAESFVENWGKVSELEAVGLGDLVGKETIRNGIMTIIRGKTNDSRALDVTATLENGEVIYIMLAGVDMFSDTEGGYLAVYNSAAGVITDYETGEVIVEWK